MTAPTRQLLALIESSLRIELDSCGVTAIGPGHDTGWRILPGCVVAQIDGGVRGAMDRRDAPTTYGESGTCAIIPPLLHHRSYVVGARSGVSRWSLFQARVLGAIDVLALVAAPQRLDGAIAAELGALNAELVACVGQDDLGAVVRRQALLHRLLARIVERSAPRPEGLALLGHAERLAPVLAHIEAHLARPLSRAGLARLAGLSPSRFHALFRAATGAAPLDYVLRQRLQRAQRLLITTAASVQEVAAAVGFADAFHFSRLFRRRCGCSPTDYRRNALGLGDR